MSITVLPKQSAGALESGFGSVQDVARPGRREAGRVKELEFTHDFK